MSNITSSQNKRFINFNKTIAIVGMLTSIIPTVFISILSLISLVTAKYNSWGFLSILLIPLSLYTMWISVIITGGKALKLEQMGLKYSNINSSFVWLHATVN